MIQLLKDVMLVKNTTKFKKDKSSKAKKGKGKEKDMINESPKNTKKPKIVVELTYFHCNEIGHWKHNCPKYLEQKKNSASTLGIYMLV